MTDNNLVIPARRGFDWFLLKFDGNDNLNDLDVSRKLGYLVNHDGTVLDRGIFSHDIARCDFPSLFEAAVVHGEAYGELKLKYVEIFAQRIDFVFCLVHNIETTFRVGAPLVGTSGEFQIHENASQYVTVEWNNGRVIKADRTYVHVQQIFDNKVQKITVPEEKEAK